jgi:S1-C subfamily serine protease
MAKEKSPIIKTIKKVMPAVVSVVISRSLKDLEKEFHDLYPQAFGMPPLNIPPEKIDAHGMVQVGGGSGFVVDPKGIVLTNKHVVTDPRADYTVVMSDGEKFDAEVLARDPLDDVAILKIKGESDLPAVELGDSESVELGQTVLAVGNALGIFKNTVSTGIVSGLSRSITAQPDPKVPAREMRGLIQTDAAINPGNSGGPLTDIFGRAIGINTAVVFGAQNIGFAIPIRAAERDLEDLKEHGRIRRPFLGLRYFMLSPDIKEKLKLPVDYGAMVTKEHPLDQAVVPGSPAAKAGIKEKDIILKWDGKKVTDEENIQDYLDDCEVGDKVKVGVLRNGKTLEKKIVLMERKQG